jgi:amidase
MGAANGPLEGLTLAVKDMYDIAGERTGGGNPDWLAAQEPAAQHANAVGKLIGAGATIIGKTVCDEFFYSVAGVNAHYGTPLNPRAPGRIPGGSSSGSASATAAGACDIGLGSDTGGSVRIPAALNGLYGIRPTHGRVDATGAMAMAPTFDCVGWMTASPGLFRKVGPVLLDGDAVPGTIVRVLVADDAFGEADAAVEALLRGVLGRMRELPAREAVTLGGREGLDQRREMFRLVQANETWATFGPFITQRQPKFGPGVKERFEVARAVSDETAAAARKEVEQVRAGLDRLIAPGTIVALPTAPCIAPMVTASFEEQEHYRLRVMRLTCTAGVGGLPQVTLPVGLVDGCPVGLSFIGWRGGDEVLLDLAVTLGRYCGATA